MKFLRVVFPPIPGVKIDRFITRSLKCNGGSKSWAVNF